MSPFPEIYERRMMPKGPRKAGYTVFPGKHNAFRITSTVGPLNYQNMFE